jgi:hypothetical protein
LTLQTSSKDREFQAKQSTQGEAKFEERTGRDDPSTRKELQGIVTQAMKGNPTMSEFVQRLESRGVTLKANVQSTERISGLSYQIRDRVMKGSDLGKSFTAAAVQKAVSYDPKRDLPSLNGERVKEVQATQQAAEQARDTPKVPQSQEAKEAWNEARGHREAMQQLSQKTRDKQASLSAELKAATAGKRALTQERWEAVKPLRGDARKEEWAKFDGRIQRQTEKIQAIKLDQAVTRSEATTKRMDLMEARYRAEIKAVSAIYEKGTVEHAKAMEKAGTAFLREAKGYAEALRKGVEGRVDRAEKGKRETGLYIDKSAQRSESIKGAGRVAFEAIKGGWKALANQASKAKELYQAGKAAVTEKTPDAWKKFQQVLKESRETFKDDLRDAKAAVKEARNLTVERVKDRDEQTRADAVEMRAERVIREQTREHGGTENVGTGRREDRPERAIEARSEGRTGSGTRERADTTERSSHARGTTSVEQVAGTSGGDQSSRDGSINARGVDAGGSRQEQRAGAEAAHGQPSEIQRDIAGPGRRESDLERSPERSGLAQEAARDTQGGGRRSETPVAGGAGSREQGREGGHGEGQGLAHRGPDTVRPEQHGKRPDSVEPRREAPGAGSGARPVEGATRATTKQQETLKQYADLLKGGGSKRGQEPVKVPHGMKRLEERIHRTEAALKAQGLDSPFTRESLQAAANKGVEKILEAYEKAGLFGDKPNRAELMKENEKQHKQMDKERQGPERPGP